MTKEEFTKLFSADPNSDDVMTEINRLYESESQLTADFASADAERNNLKKELDEANKRYRERFLSGENPDKDKEKENGGNRAISFDSLFKDS